MIISLFFVDMNHNQIIIVVKVLKAYIDLLIVLSNVANWLKENERRHHERRTLRQRNRFPNMSD